MPCSHGWKKFPNRVKIKAAMEQLQTYSPASSPKPFTYGLPSDLIKEATIGKRVIVPLEKLSLTLESLLDLTQPPLSCEVKPVECILDTQASVSNNQLQLWEWMAHYYLCSLGLIMKAALPSVFLLESETILEKNETATIDWDALGERSTFSRSFEKGYLTFNDTRNIIGKKTIGKHVGNLLASHYVFQQQLLKETYRPKKKNSCDCTSSTWKNRP